MTDVSTGRTEGLAVFDFDGTLIPFQSPDLFVSFIVSRVRPRGVGFKELVRKIFLKTLSRVLAGRARSDIHKRLVLWKLRGVSRADIEGLAREFYFERICPALRPEVLSRLEECRTKGWRIWLVSASYDIYLSHFCRAFRIDRLIATRIRFRRGVCSGRIDGRDVVADEKVRRILLALSSERWRPGQTAAVSDSASDLPLLRWARTAVVVHPASARAPVFQGDLPCEFIPCKT